MARMETVVFLKYSPLTAKVYEDYCFKALLDAGFNVEYWNITALFSFNLSDYESYKPIDNVVVRNVLSYEELDGLVKKNLTSLFISLMTCGFNQAKLLRIFTSNNILTAFWGPDPVYSQKAPLNRRFRRVTLKKILGILENYLMYILLRLNIFHYYNYYFSVGLYGFRQIGIFDNHLLSKAKSLPVNSFDYNNYHYNTRDSLTLNNNYIVFIDQYLPLHPDNEIIGQTTIPPGEYYDSLNDFFTYLEKSSGLEVIIAAHPKAIKYKQRNFFEGRKVIFNQAGSLIRNSQLVLAHFSTAIDYAIMSYKPVLLLDSKLFENKAQQYSDYISQLATRFGLSKVYFDHYDGFQLSNNVLSITEPQRKTYNSFIEEFCKSVSIKSSNSVLVPSYIDKIFKESVL